MFKKILRHLELLKQKLDGWKLDRDIKAGRKLRGRQINPNQSEEIVAFRQELSKTGNEIVARPISKTSVRLDILRVDGSREIIEVPATIVSME